MFSQLFFHFVDAQLCRANYHHITFLSILISLFIMQGWMYSLWLPFHPFHLLGYLEEPSSLGITSTILFSCLTDAFQMPSDSVLRRGSHQHLALVVHHHPTIISQWLPQSNTQHGHMDRVLWAELKSWGYSGAVINLKTSLALLYHTSSTWRVRMEHGRMVSPMNANLCSSKPFTNSLKGQFENSLLFFCYNMVLTNNF